MRDCLYAHSASSSAVVIMDMESSCEQVKSLFLCFVAGYIDAYNRCCGL